MFEVGQAGVLHEALQLVQVFVPPLGAQARRHAERVRAHRVVGRSAGGPTGTERIAAQHDAFSFAVVSQLFHLRLVLLVAAFEVEAAAKGEDYHLEAHFGALVNRQFDRVRARAAHVHEHRILRHPRRDRPIHAALSQPLALALGGIVREFKCAEALEAAARGDLLIRALRRAALQQAGRVAVVVDLREVFRIGAPVDAPIAPFAAHAAEGVIGLHVEARQFPALIIVHIGLELHGGENLAHE